MAYLTTSLKSTHRFSDFKAYQPAHKSILDVVHILMPFNRIKTLFYGCNTKWVRSFHTILSLLAGALLITHLKNLTVITMLHLVMGLIQISLPKRISWYIQVWSTCTKRGAVTSAVGLRCNIYIYYQTYTHLNLCLSPQNMNHNRLLCMA